jgi:lanosterol synthase
MQIPGMIITLYATGTPVPEEWRIEIARYLANVQRNNGKDDSGWGLYGLSCLSICESI